MSGEAVPFFFFPLMNDKKLCRVHVQWEFGGVISLFLLSFLLVSLTSGPYIDACLFKVVLRVLNLWRERTSDEDDRHVGRYANLAIFCRFAAAQGSVASRLGLKKEEEICFFLTFLSSLVQRRKVSLFRVRTCSVYLF